MYIHQLFQVVLEIFISSQGELEIFGYFIFMEGELQIFSTGIGGTPKLQPSTVDLLKIISIFLTDSDRDSSYSPDGSESDDSQFGTPLQKAQKTPEAQIKDIGSMVIRISSISREIASKEGNNYIQYLYHLFYLYLKVIRSYILYCNII